MDSLKNETPVGFNRTGVSSVRKNETDFRPFNIPTLRESWSDCRLSRNKGENVRLSVKLPVM